MAAKRLRGNVWEVYDGFNAEVGCRKDLNEPPTAVGGIVGTTHCRGLRGRPEGGRPRKEKEVLEDDGPAGIGGLGFGVRYAVNFQPGFVKYRDDATLVR